MTLPQAKVNHSIELPSVPDKEQSLTALNDLLEIGSKQEQDETMTFLKQSLDEDRLSDRKLFS